MTAALIIGFVLGGVLAIVSFVSKQKELSSGQHNIVCPMCKQTGYVMVRLGRVKRGVSGGKATGALLTGGLSLLFVGLSRVQEVTNARCGNCKQSWIIE